MTDLADKLAGKFIVIDGPDGAGKTTQLAKLHEHLVGSDCSVESVVDPGSTQIGLQIRHILLDRHGHAEMGSLCETLLFMASCAQLIHELVRPALDEGKLVLCDRFVSATVAYQGALGVDPEMIMRLADIAIDGLWPDLTIILDLPEDVGMKRIGIVRERLKTDEEQPYKQLSLFGDRLETRASDYHREVRRIYRSLGEVYPHRVEYVDARGSQAEVFDRTLKAVCDEFSA